MDRTSKLLRRRIRRIVCRHWSIAGHLAIRAPMTFVGAGFGVEDDDAPVAIAVGYIDLMRGLVHVDVGWAAEILLVVAAPVLSGFADLHDELAIKCEFQ